MERPNRRGKIPRKDWPSIIERYEAGETLASIAHTYDCSAPAISYVVSRSRARDRGANGAAEPEPEAAKVDGNAAGVEPPQPEEQQAGETTKQDRPSAEEPAMPSQPPRQFDASLLDRTQAAGPTHERSSLQRREAGAHENNSDMRPARPAFASPNGGQRRILHLSLGTAGQGDGAAAHQPYPRQEQKAESGERAASMPGNAAMRTSETIFPGRGNAYEPAPSQRRPEPHSARETVTALDPALRQRVNGDISAFLEAFDGALAQDTAESRAQLREATDRLLRAGARTRIELERLEARVPLPPRDQERESGSAWWSR